MTDDAPLFCDRCLRQLTPGNGDFYEVQIAAIADPAPPNLDQVDTSPEQLTRELDALVHSMEDLSPREAMDQVHREVVIHLCLTCYRRWIENPAGS